MPDHPKHKTKIAVLYARVSSDEQEKEGFSIPAQVKLLTDYAADEGICIVEQFKDVETAKQAGRKEFTAMVKFLHRESESRDRDRRCRAILVEKTDRLYRNLRDYLTLDELDLDIHFVKEATVISPDSHSSQKFLHGIKVLMAKNYVDNLSEEVKKGMREKAEQGIWPSKAPNGYRNVEGSDGKKRIEPDPAVAPIVTKMFEMYATGTQSMKDIGLWAVNAGLPLEREGNVAAVVQHMLKNPIYCGWFRFKGKRYVGDHIPLVTEELWNRVQSVREQRRARKRRRSKRDYAFSRLISCGHCGCALVGEQKVKKDTLRCYTYYRCTHYRGKCPDPYVREEVLEKKFTEILRTLSFDEEVLNLVRQALLQSHQDEAKFREEALERLRGDYDRLQKRIDAMYVDKLDGKVGDRFYQQKSDEWREEQKQITRAMSAHERANQTYMEDGVALLDLASRAADLFQGQPPSEKRRLLDFVLSNCTWKDGELTPVFRQPFDIIADGAAVCAAEAAAGTLQDSLYQSKLPR